MEHSDYSIIFIIGSQNKISPECRILEEEFYIYIYILWWLSGKESSWQHETWVQSLGLEDPLEEEMTIYSSILAWRSPWTKQPGGLQSWSHKELDMPERWSTHIHIELIICHYPVESACKAGDTGDEDSIRGLGISSGEGNGNLLQYSYQENLMDRGAWWAIVHGVTKSRTWLKLLSSCA